MNRLLIVLLLCLTVLNANAQKTAFDEVKRLQARMYKLYSGYDYDEFISVTDSLKRAAEEAGDDRMFYRAWANKVLFSSNRQRRSRAMQIAKEMQEHAIMNDQLQEANTNLKTAYDQLEETTTAKERMESELRIAREIQMGMVPSLFPQHDHIDIYGILKPAKEVGGDLYDFFIQNNKLYFCIGDVSGKGIPASLFMSVIVNLFRMVAKEGFPPEYIATRLNETVSENNENGMFCTMFIGEIDMQSGKLLYCNAGHNPPVMMAGKQDGETSSKPVFVEMESNVPIGLWPELVFKGEEIENVKGRPLFLYTDGLSEAEDGEQLQFGDDRVLDVIASHPFEGARQLVERLSDSVKQHVGNAPQSDDLTMLCIMCS